MSWPTGASACPRLGLADHAPGQRRNDTHGRPARRGGSEVHQERAPEPRAPWTERRAADRVAPRSLEDHQAWTRRVTGSAGHLF